MKALTTLIQKNKILITIGLAISMVFGAISYINIPKQSFPTLEMPIIQVDVIAPGYNAQEVDEEIVAEIEKQIKTIDEVDITSSFSFANGASIIISFGLDNEINVNEQFQNLDHKIDSLDLAEDVEISFKTDFYESHAIFAVTGEDRQETAEALVANLSRVEEINDLRINPIQEKQLNITVDINKLNSLNISYPQLIELLTAQGLELPLGYSKDDEQFVPVISTNNFSSSKELEQLVLFVNPLNGQSVLLSDIASITTGSTNDSYYEHNGEPATLVEVYFKQNKDYTKVGTEIEDIVTNTEGSENIYKVSFQPDDVRNEISKIFSNLLQSIALVFVIVLLGLGIRNSLMISVSFPFVIMSTIATLYVLGMDLQKISIAGLIIAIGIIVDNAIVMSETIQYHVDNQKSRYDAIRLALKQNFTALVTSTLTTIAAFTPLLLLPGIAGKIAVSLPTTVIVALVLSFIFSIIVLPVLAFKLAKPSRKKLQNPDTSTGDSNSKTTKFFQKVYKKPKTVIAISIITALVMMFTITKLVIQVFPTADQNVVYITYTNKNSTNVDDTKELEEEIISYIEDLSYIDNNSVKSYTSIVGGNMPQYYSTLPVFPLNANQGYIYMITDIDKTTQLKADLTDDLAKEFEEQATLSVGEIELNSPTPPITVYISGDNYEQIMEFANEKIEQISELEGVSKVNYNFPSVNPMYQIVYNDQYLLTNGIQPIEVEQVIALYLNKYDLDIIGIDGYSDTAYINSNITSISDLSDSTFIINGTSHKASQLFSLKQDEAYNFYTRYNLKSSLSISIYNTTATSAIALQDSVDQVMNDNKPDSLDLTYESESTLATDVFGDVGVAAFAAFVLIGVILIFEFKKFKTIIAILISIPLSISGAIFILYLLNIPVTFSVALGITSLLGIVVNNGILLVSYIEQYNDQYDNILDACANGTTRRLRPILLSNITTMFGLLPLMISTSSFFQPMAIALFGGLFTGVIFTIFVTPSAYYLFNRSRKDD